MPPYAMTLPNVSIDDAGLTRNLIMARMTL